MKKIYNVLKDNLDLQLELICTCMCITLAIVFIVLCYNDIMYGNALSRCMSLSLVLIFGVGGGALLWELITSLKDEL